MDDYDQLIDIVSNNEEDEIYMVRMTKSQYEELMYCYAQIEKGREKARQKYYIKKEKEGKKTRKAIIIPEEFVQPYARNAVQPQLPAQTSLSIVVNPKVSPTYGLPLHQPLQLVVTGGKN